MFLDGIFQQSCAQSSFREMGQLVKEFMKSESNKHFHLGSNHTDCSEKKSISIHEIKDFPVNTQKFVCFRCYTMIYKCFSFFFSFDAANPERYHFRSSSNTQPNVFNHNVYQFLSAECYFFLISKSLHTSVG